MAAYFKSLDPNHLIIHTWSNHALDPERLDPNIDICNRHYYAGGKKTFAERCREDRSRVKGKRPYVVGEYGPYIDGKNFTNENVVAKHREFLTAVEESGTSGALIWSMYFHHRNGGFYWHQIFTYPSVWSYHWPGFPSAEAQKEREILGACVSGVPHPGLGGSAAADSRSAAVAPVGDAHARARFSRAR